MGSVIPFHPGGFGREPLPSAEGYTVELFLPAAEEGASSKEQDPVRECGDHTQHGFQEHTPTWTSLLPLGHLQDWRGSSQKQPLFVPSSPTSLPSHSSLPLLHSLFSAGRRVRRSLLSPKPCQTSMVTRFGCEAWASNPALPLLGAGIHLPEPASFVGREGLVMGGQGKRQQEEPVSAQPPKLLPLSLGQDP